MTYLTAPVPSAEMPKGIPYIVGNEAAERFSFYGMKTILLVFMTEHLLARDGSWDLMTPNQANETIALFVALAYFCPIVGALLSDGLLGKYRTILLLSLVYCLGHLCLAVDQTRLGMYLGLTLIGVGAGGIKPCVSSHVGDQFGATNQYLLAKVFAWFYFSINLGAFVSTLLTPYLRVKLGLHWAFGVPGVLMLVATVVFWMGRYRFIHIPPGGLRFIRESFSGEGQRAVRRLAGLYLFVAVFWSLFDQTGAAWITQAKQMNRQLWFWQPEPDQVGAANPLLILTFIPLFTYGVYPAIGRFFPLTPLRKISIGFFLAALSFASCAGIEHALEAGYRPHVAWQMLNYVILTAAEVMVSITCLEYSYTQAPKTMKSFIMAVFFLSVSLGNLVTWAVNRAIQDEMGLSTIRQSTYFWIFTWMMAIAAMVFVVYARHFREQTYLQDEGPPQPAAS